MSKEYDEYLTTHITNVKKAACWMLDNINDVMGLSESEAQSLFLNVERHDESKYGIDEYDPYDSYFYGEPDEDAFNMAWLRHIHKNEHHWQHWVLINDDGEIGDPRKIVAIEMPKVYAIEMIADWWSFSWRSGNLFEVFGWHEGHKAGMILHPNTRKYVESVLGKIREIVGDEAK